MAMNIQMSNAVEDALVMCYFVLLNGFNISKEQAKAILEDLKTFAKNYKDGMTDDHIVAYFTQREETKVTLKDGTVVEPKVG